MASTFQVVLFGVFTAFFVLIGLACLGVLLGMFKKADPRLSAWAIPGFFAGLTAAIFGMFRVFFLTAAAPMIMVTLAPVTETGEPAAPLLTSGSYEYDSTDNGKSITHTGRIEVALGNGGWEAHVPGEVGQSAVILHFTDESNKQWKTTRFFSNHINQKVMQGTPVSPVADHTWELPGVAVVSAAEPGREAAAQAQAQIKFNNYARTIADQYSRKTWEWRVFVDEPPAVLRTISQVEYVLHPTFQQPFQSSTDRDNQFELKASGWGGFDILITVHYTDGRQEKTSYFLNLQKTWPTPSSVQLSLQKILVKEDGSGGKSTWRFDVLVNGTMSLRLPNAGYDDVSHKGGEYLPGARQWTTTPVAVPAGQPIRVDVKGTRRVFNDTVSGFSTLGPNGGPLVVNVTNPTDPTKGTFVFYLSGMTK